MVQKAPVMALDDPLFVIAIITLIVLAVVLFSYAAYKIVKFLRRANRFLDEREAEEKRKVPRPKIVIIFLSFLAGHSC
ncbi:MAG: hypothetical protein ACREBS_11260 [Nitrososphaerales archaeon]